MLTALLLAVAYVAGAPVAPAAAADRVRVDLTSMSPSIATPGDTITLNGTVTNTSDAPLSSLQAYFWRDQRLRTTRDQLDAASAPVGARHLPSFVTVGTDGALYPGERADFTVTMPMSRLGVPSSDGVTMVGVHIRGTDDSGNATLGRARAWLPQDVDTRQGPADVVSVVVLAATPSRLRADLFIDDHLAREVATGGRLDALLDLAGRTGRTWLVDPALLVGLRDMADDSGYALSDGTAATGQSAAKAWLKRFDTLTTEGHRLPYASTDIGLIGSINRSDVLRAALTPATVPADVADLPVAAWPAGGILSEDGVAALDAVGTPATVLASNVADSTSVSADRTVVAYDPEALAAGPEMDDSDTQMRQVAAATTFLDAVGDRRSQVRVITDATSAAVDRADPSTRTRLSALPTTADPRLSFDDQAPTDARGAQVIAAANDRAGLESMFTDPASAADMTSRMVASLASTQWEGQAAGYEAFRSWERVQADSILRGDALSISARSVLLTAQEDTQFPVTVTNNLTESVTVRVLFTSENADRLYVPAVEVAIGAGEANGVSVVPKVEANGRYTVVAQLTTPSGRPIGSPVDIDVEATQAGRVGWILMIVSGIVVIGTTVLRVKQVRTERSRA